MVLSSEASVDLDGLEGQGRRLVVGWMYVLERRVLIRIDGLPGVRSSKFKLGADDCCVHSSGNCLESAARRRVLEEPYCRALMRDRASDPQGYLRMRRRNDSVRT